MSEKDVFQVIKIIDRYHIVINGGTNDSLSEGDQVDVFIEGEELYDQFNDNELLGTLDYIKAKLTISEVYPKFSVCVNEVEETIEEPPAFMKATAWMSNKSVTKTYFKSIPVKAEDVTGGFPESGKEVEVGDTVRRRYI